MTASCRLRMPHPRSREPSSPAAIIGGADGCIAGPADGCIVITGASMRGASAGGRTRSASRCSSTVALFDGESDTRARIPVSHPSAITTTPAMTATPSTRRTQTSTPRLRFIIRNTPCPASSASASAHAAPAAKVRSSAPLRIPPPSTAAPVRIRPRIGPAHGVHSKPVETPSASDPPIDARPSRGGWSSPPSRTNGRDNESAMAGNSSAAPKTAKSTIASARPN